MSVINKIDEYLINDDIASLIDLAILMEDGELDEGFIKKSKGILPKMGIQVKKEEGLLDKLRKPELREFFKQLIRAARGDEDAKAKVKELTKGSISKGEIVNTILKLDSVTLKLLSTPLKFLKLITGWQITGIKDQRGVMDRIKTAMDALRNLADNLTGKDKKQVTNYVANIKRLESGIV